jgi:hypothetical protein
MPAVFRRTKSQGIANKLAPARKPGDTKGEVVRGTPPTPPPLRRPRPGEAHSRKVPRLDRTCLASVAFLHHFALTSGLHRLSPKLDDAMYA